MDANLQRYYESRLDMMSSPAWNDLIEDIEAMIASTNELSSVPDVKTLH